MTGQTQIEIARAAMKRAIGTPSLDSLPLASFAGGGKAALDALEGKGRQGREPVKPGRGIRDQGKDALSGRNDDILAVGPRFDEGKQVRTSARRSPGRGSGATWGRRV